MHRILAPSYKQIRKGLVNKKYYEKKKKENVRREESSRDASVSPPPEESAASFQEPQFQALLQDAVSPPDIAPQTSPSNLAFFEFLKQLEDQQPAIDLPSDHEEQNVTLSVELAQWATACNTPLSHLSSLLKILKKPREPGEYEALPVTGGTLLAHNIQKNEYTMISECGPGGEMWYKSIRTSVLEKIKNNQITPGEDIIIDIGIDGLPLFKSSEMALWPILGCTRDPSAIPFIIGVYWGLDKPPPEDLLKSFVTEVEYLKSSPLEVESRSWKIIMGNYIMDAEARAHLKYIKTHAGFYGCERCTTKGRNYKKRMVFTNIDAPLRTDDSFLKKKQKSHHVGTCPLIRCGTKMITRIPLDYMHLVCLGVMRRLFYFWMKYLNPQRLSRQKRLFLAHLANKIAEWTPRDFNRKPKNINFWKRFKATELRTFLLYTGPMVLKDVLSSELYNHFMKLSTGIYILVSEKFCLEKNVLAEKLLREFVRDAGRLYGDEFVVYNVHSLIHLAAEVKCQGKPLDYFSAFRYENFLRVIKTWVKSGFKPLQQIIRKDKERTSYLNKRNVTRESAPRYYQWGKYKRVIFNKMIISTRSLKDSCVNTKFGIGIVKDILKVSGSGTEEIILSVNLFTSHTDWYVSPCHSGELSIFEVRNMSSDVKKVKLKNVFGKCFLMPEKNDRMVVIPLAHAAF